MATSAFEEESSTEEELEEDETFPVSTTDTFLVKASFTASFTISSALSARGGLTKTESEASPLRGLEEGEVSADEMQVVGLEEES